MSRSHFAGRISAWSGLLLVSFLTSMDTTGADLLCVCGWDEVFLIELKDWDSSKPSLVQIATYTLPARNGHDLQAVPQSPSLIVTTGQSVFLFDRDKHEFRPHPQLGFAEDIKSVSVHARSGRIVYTRAEAPAWWTDKLHFLASAGEIQLKTSASIKLAGFLTSLKEGPAAMSKRTSFRWQILAAGEYA
jgi:hypothetical protein